MFLINSLTQHRKFAGPFLLPVYRVCKESVVVHYFCHPVRNFWDRIFYFTPLERGIPNGSFKWLNHPELPIITELQCFQILNRNFNYFLSKHS